MSWADLSTLALVPSKVGSLLGALVRQWQDMLGVFCLRKARRKDKEPSTPCPDDPKLYLEEAVLERKLPDIDLRVLVDLPAGLDYNEWLASHTIAFFDHINLVYGTISEFCTMSGCPDMTGPGLRTYLWFDDKGKKTRVAAPQYIDYVMTFTQKTISDESIFPTKYANEFPSSFESIVRKILRLLFHVLAHLYHCHFREVVLLNLHAHLNCVFAHLTLFNHRFQLIESKETDILQDLEVALRVHSDNSANPADPVSSEGEGEQKGEGSDREQEADDLNKQPPDLILATNASVVEKDVWKTTAADGRNSATSELGVDAQELAS
ncbi:MOB kinase activator-like 2 isoform X2 [Anabrus simplex]|uniref:MOB kinase activator-like 2 isoform X2 n=1 Tax=Anabrus simplex TaxID=316456 RepID=UPI0034DD9A6A